MGTRTITAAFLVALGTAAAPEAFQLTRPSLAAFDRYAALTEQRITSELSGAQPFLWVDRQPASERARLMALLQQGQVPSARLETRDAGRAVDPGEGMIHHWIGTVFLPDVTLDRTIAFLQDYNRYADRFQPMIQRSRLVSRSGDRFVARMRTWSSKMAVTVVLDGDYTIDYKPIGSTKMFTKSVTSNIEEVESAGTPAERRYPADQREAFLWRLNTYCSFEQRAEGVYEQCESISLTRSIPWMVRYLVRPFVTGIPRETLEATLGAVRAQLH